MPSKPQSIRETVEETSLRFIPGKVYGKIVIEQVQITE